MFAPLDVDGDLPSITPLGVQQLAVPEGPNVGGRFGRIVPNPDDLLVGRDGERDPRAVDVVLPEEVIGDDPTHWMNDGDDPLKREPLVALDV